VGPDARPRLDSLMAFAKNEHDRYSTSPALFETAPPKRTTGKPQIATRTTLLAELSDDGILLKARCAADREVLRQLWPKVLELLAEGAPVSAITYRDEVAAGNAA
jgi:hypothetical protein